MPSWFAPWCVQTRISASACEGEKPHQGVASQNPAPFPGRELSNSRTALGLALWAGKTVSGPAVAANNGQPQQPQQPQKPQQPQPQQRTTFQTVCGNWGLVNIGWGSFNLGTRFFILASGPVAPEVATFNLVSSISNSISGLTRAAVCP